LRDKKNKVGTKHAERRRSAGRRVDEAVTQVPGTRPSFVKMTKLRRKASQHEGTRTITEDVHDAWLKQPIRQ
jgi:hypothetical protein